MMYHEGNVEQQKNVCHTSSSSEIGENTFLLPLTSTWTDTSIQWCVLAAPKTRLNAHTCYMKQRTVTSLTKWV